MPARSQNANNTRALQRAATRHKLGVLVGARAGGLSVDNALTMKEYLWGVFY